MSTGNVSLPSAAASSRPLSSCHADLPAHVATRVPPSTALPESAAFSFLKKETLPPVHTTPDVGSLSILSSQSLRMSERSQTGSSGCTSSADSGRGTCGLPPLDMSLSMSREYSSLPTSFSSSSTPNQTLKLSSDSAFNFENRDPFLFSMPSQEPLDEYQADSRKESSCGPDSPSCKRTRDSDSICCDWTRGPDMDLTAQRSRHPRKKRQRMQTIVLD